MGARELLADLKGEGLSVTAEGDRLVIRPASKLTDDMRAALREAKPALLELLAGEAETARRMLAEVEWQDADIERFKSRFNRLVRWGWPTADAEALAERLTLRDRAGDTRVSCADCRHYGLGRCCNHRRAGLQTPEVGRDLAAMLQRCAGFDHDSGTTP